MNSSEVPTVNCVMDIVCFAKFKTFKRVEKYHDILLKKIDV